MKKEPKVQVIHICIGIVSLACLEGYALYLGFNGTILKIVIAVIALAIGVVIPNKWIK